MKNKQDIRNENENMDVLMRAIKAVHSVAVNSSSMSEADLMKQRNEQEFFSKLITPSLKINSEKISIEDIPAEYIRPDFAHGDKNIILYCHGGGYTCGGLNYARILGAKLAINTGIEVMSFAYRLAPENPYPAAIEDAMKVYDYLLLQGYGAKNVIIAGDSAGGNLAMEIVLRLKSQGRKLPLALVLMSPWADMSMSGRSYEECADMDPLITKEYINAVRRAYAGEDADYESAEFSPLFGDLEGFPPVLVQVGSHEILKSDSEVLAEKIIAVHSHAELEIYDGGWHVFQQMPISMSQTAMKNINKFIRNYI